MWFGESIDKLRELGLVNYEYLWKVVEVIDSLNSLPFK